MTKRTTSRIDSMNIIRQQADEIVRLRVRVEQLEVDLELTRNDRPGPKPPTWLKPNSPEPKGPKHPRKKRPKGFARKRGIADRQVMHAVERCPSCECVLQGGTVGRRREVIEVVLSPAEVTERVVVERVCPFCAKRCVSKLGVKDGIVGRHRFGPKLLALRPSSLKPHAPSFETWCIGTKTTPTRCRHDHTSCRTVNWHLEVKGIM